MSEPRIGTGKAEIRTCKVCGLGVEHQQSEGMYGSGVHWHCEPHNAPCGLLCWGGGARGREGLRAYRERRMHGLKGTCPICDKQGSQPNTYIADDPVEDVKIHPMAEHLGSGWRFLEDPMRKTIVILHTGGLWTEIPRGIFNSAFSASDLYRDSWRAMAEALNACVGLGGAGLHVLVVDESDHLVRVSLEASPEHP